MLFSKRLKLEKEYRKWLKKNSEAKDEVLSCITFLDKQGLLKEDVFPIEFNLDMKQFKKLQEWKKKQKKDYAGAIGGEYTYSFTQTGLGTVVVVKNNIFNKEIDLTDYEGW
ncbi:MAG: hypothetical protein WC438_05980 [Candidatus Pacearchaeota archaeon]|jgi:hypothetical protein